MSRAETSDLPRRLPDAAGKGESLRAVLEAFVASLAAGAALPSERVLAERYGLARMTVRGEIDRLVAEGAVYRLHGRGTFVAEPRVAQAMAFSSFSEDMRARGMTPGATVRSRVVVEAGPFLCRSLEVPEAAVVVEIERVRTADGEPVALERVYLPLARYPGVDEADLSAGSLFELLAERYGVRLREAGQRVVSVAIEPEEAELLRVEPGDPGLRFHTVARDAEGAPAFYATSLFRGDRYEIEIHQTREEGAA
jgi:GntR family transcriptional regulator